MIAFITGLVIGGAVGFLACAICSVTRSKEPMANAQRRATGEEKE